METSQQRLPTPKKWIPRMLVSLLYGTFFRKHRGTGADSNEPPKRILLLNGFHVGDIVIATSVLPVLRSAYPDVEIGFAVGSWSQMVVKNHPEVKYIHCVDHWRLNRGSTSLLYRLLQYRRTRRVALKEIRKLKYDVAISLFTNFPDLLDLSWAAKIPERIGFRQSIYSSLATRLVDQPEGPFVTQGARLAETLHALPINPIHFQLRQPCLPSSDDSSIQEVCSLLMVSNLDNVRYRVIHMGSGAVQREMPIAFWHELAEKLSPECILLFTGRGKREEANISATIGGLRNCVNACDRLSWNGFVAAVRYGEVLYGVESMAGHVAGAVHTKCIVVYGGTAGVGRWRPEGEDCIVMTNHVSCAPCLQAQGCAAMACMQNISTDELVRLSH